MANFESGVYGYVHAVATVDVFFPVDSKGNADICCKQCPFFSESGSKCRLNGSICAYPNKYVGDHCPLEKTDE